MDDLMSKRGTSVFIVTYQDGTEYPVITVFNNEEAAEKCLAYFGKIHDWAWIDKAPVYNDFVGEIT